MTGSVYDEFPKRVKKMWADAEKEERRKAGIDVDMEDEEEGDKDHRDIFARDPMKNVFNGYGSESDSDSDEDSDESSDHGSDMEFNVMVSQNYF